ncbi:MAG TPA: M64 family metallopeptidase [Flavobacteriales bacterium]|nr:M64 family metallopeptidase [Flavobacteriales bacterium]
MKKITYILTFISTFCNFYLEGQSYFSGISNEQYLSLPSNPSEVDNNKIHLVILSDGYTNSTSDENKFLGVINPTGIQERGDAEEFLFDISRRAPYKEYFNYFRIYKVFEPSENSGIEHPANLSANAPSCENTTITPQQNFNSRFNSSLDRYGFHAGLATTDIYASIIDFLSPHFGTVTEDGIIKLPPNVLVVVIVNDANYAGTANIKRRICLIAGRNTTYNPTFPYNSISSNGYIDRNKDGAGATHEFSHIFGGLQDEYWFPCPTTNDFNCVDFHNAPNRWNSTSSQPTPWLHWMNYSSISTFGIFGITGTCANPQWTSSPPSPDYKAPRIQGYCFMGTLYATEGLCAVCREAIIERIHNLVSPINSSSPSTNNGDVFPISSSQNFEVNLTIPLRTDIGTSSMVVNWFLLDENESNVLESLHQEVPSVTPVNPAAAIYKFTNSSHPSICDWFNGKEAGNYKIKVEVYDRAGASEDLSDNSRWVRDPNHSTHKHYVIWNVYYSGIAGIDLYSSDSDLDLGAEPSYVAPVNWESPDIWVTNFDNLTGLEHENPVYVDGEPANVHVWIKNRGCKVFDPTATPTPDAGTVNFYWSKANTVLDWTDSWSPIPFLDHPAAIQGDYIGQTSITEMVDAAAEPVQVSVAWDVPDPSIYDFLGSDMVHFCLLTSLDATGDGITDPTEGNTYEYVRANNNVAQKNLTVIDDQTFTGAAGDGNTEDRVTGAAVIIGNPSSTPQTFRLKFKVPAEETGKPITEEAEVRIILSDTLWNRWTRGSQTGSGVQVYNASRRQILLTTDSAWIGNMNLDTAEFEPLYVSVNFLTQERSSKELFTLRVLHTLEDSSSTILGGETYLIKPDPYRTSFTADAGNDKELLVGTTWNQSAKTLTETATYNWYNSSGTKIHSGATLSDTTTTVSSETYTLEVIAQSDGYKDYDEVTITSKLGKINSIVPNPINSGTFTIDYSVSTSASSPKIKVLNINSGIYTEHTISTGNGTLSLAISGYVAGSYSVILICSSQNADDELLIIQ